MFLQHSVAHRAPSATMANGLCVEYDALRGGQQPADDAPCTGVLYDLERFHRGARHGGEARPAWAYWQRARSGTWLA